VKRFIKQECFQLYFECSRWRRCSDAQFLCSCFVSCQL